MATAGEGSDQGTTVQYPPSTRASAAEVEKRAAETSNVVAPFLEGQVFGTAPAGVIGRHKPREIIRIERDYAAGELPQFWSGYLPELEGRITATQHARLMNDLNATLASAYDPYRSIFDNALAVATLYLSTWIYASHYEKQMKLFKDIVRKANQELYNPVGLNILDPLKVAYLFIEIEYY